MRKIYKKYEYRKWHNSRSRKIQQKGKRDKPYNKKNAKPYESSKHEIIEGNVITAPSSICTFSDPENSLAFFQNLRKDKNVYKVGRTCFIKVDLSAVTNFDYSSVCIFVAIIENLKLKNIIVRTILPKDKKCKEEIIKSGILTNMVNSVRRQTKV
ncbi:hypothetical protein, partial [Ornithobacterium rhinotracheale]